MNIIGNILRWTFNKTALACPGLVKGLTMTPAEAAEAAERQHEPQQHKAARPRRTPQQRGWWRRLKESM